MAVLCVGLPHPFTHFMIQHSSPTSAPTTLLQERTTQHRLKERKVIALKGYLAETQHNPHERACVGQILFDRGVYKGCVCVSVSL